MTSLSFDAALDLDALDLDALDFDTLDGATIELTADQIRQAGAGKSWILYLETLAQMGLGAWFADHHLTASLIAGSDDDNRWVTRGFQVQGLMVSASEEDVVYVKRNINPAHFYILTQVSEEHGQVKVSGFVRSEVFQSLIQSYSRFGDGYGDDYGDDCGDDFELPITAFNSNPAMLLLALRCAEHQAIELPIAVPSVVDRVVNLRSWIQGHFNQGVNQGLDAISEALDWTPLQPVGVRSELPQILQSLARRGIRLADNAQGASQMITVAKIPLRLYVMTSEISDAEWGILAVLESATLEPMPMGTILRLSDDRTVLIEQRFDGQETTDRSIFTEVVSGMDESVLVEIVLPNGVVYPLPRFVFAS